MAIVVKTQDGDTHKFPTARGFKFKTFGKFILFYGFRQNIVAVFKVKDVIGWWEE